MKKKDLEMVEKMSRTIANRILGRHKGRTSIFYSELQREGYFGAAKAYQTFNPDKDMQFSTYLFQTMQFYMLNYVRRQFHKYNVSNVEFNEEFMNSTEDKDDLETKEIAEEIFNFIDNLQLDPSRTRNVNQTTKVYKTIFNEIFVKGLSFRECAKKVNLSHERVNQISEKLKYMIKNHLKTNYNYY